MNSIIFLSFDEPNADTNWNFLKEKFPRAKRVSNVKGILPAHQACSNVSSTEHFFIVDADNVVLDSFNFSYNPTESDRDAIHVWRCKNPVNDLVYGYGAIKLYSKSLLVNANEGVDLATSVGKKYKIMHELASVTHFNTTPLNAWRSAFRECAKLSSQIIPGQCTPETEARLDSWCTVGEDRENGRWCIAGARAGKKFGANNRENPNVLMKINDFNWLKQLFEMMRDGTKRI